MNDASTPPQDSAPPIRASRRQAVGIIELARPAKYNCLSSAAYAAIEAAIDAFESPGSGVRAILVQAQGKNFCTGADLDEVLSLRSEPAALRRFIGLGHRALKRLEACELPVVAACQGLSLAGGCELMLACDVVFAAQDARFGDQHAQYGLLPGWGASQRLPRLIGLRRSLDLFFTARWIDANTALQWGLVNHLAAPELLRQVAFDYCAAMATRSRTGLAVMKRLARQGLDGPMETGLQMEEADTSIGLLHPDVSEGLDAFRNRRPPRFTA
jgi:enoyl-CoA hydratase